MKTLALNYLLLTLFALAGCSQQEKPLRAVFLPDGNLQVHAVETVKGIKIFDARHGLVAASPVFENKIVELRFSWHADEIYTVFFDDKKAGAIAAPRHCPRYRVRLHAPIGQKSCDFYLTGEGICYPDTSVIVPVHGEESVDLVFEVEKLDDTVLSDVRISVAPEDIKDTAQFMPHRIEDSASLEFEFDKRLWSMKALITAETSETTVCRASIIAGGEKRVFHVRFTRAIADRDFIRIVDWNLPTGPDGLASARQSPGTILVPNALWMRVASLFGVKVETIDFFRPFTFQTVRIANDGNEPSGLMLTGEIIDASTNIESPWFRAPDNQFTGGTDKIISFVSIEPGQTETCVLPVYMAHNTPAGAFKSRITVQRLGSDHVFERIENSVSIVRSNVLFTSWTLAIAILSLGWLAAVIVFYRRIVDSIGLRTLVLLSLLGSLQFCLSFAGRTISSVMYAILGPFNCLVGGLLTEVLTYLLVTSILFLVPRVGAMTLAGIVSYIMGCIMLGSFGLTDILFLGSGIAFRELFLFVFGVTRFRQPVGQPRIVPMMIALGIADAASTFTSITLHVVFYRLYFADWYIMLNVIVTGFLYTVIGVYLGRPLGQSLRKVHM